MPCAIHFPSFASLETIQPPDVHVAVCCQCFNYTRTLESFRDFEIPYPAIVRRSSSAKAINCGFCSHAFNGCMSCIEGLGTSFLRCWACGGTHEWEDDVEAEDDVLKCFDCGKPAGPKDLWEMEYHVFRNKRDSDGIDGVDEVFQETLEGLAKKPRFFDPPWPLPRTVKELNRLKAMWKNLVAGFVDYSGVESELLGSGGIWGNGITGWDSGWVEDPVS